MADYLYSPEARLDLLEIWEYIATDDLDADRVELEIEQARQPHLGHLRRDLTSKSVRFWPVHTLSFMTPPLSRLKWFGF